MREEFEDPGLAGWRVDSAGGQARVSDSVLHLEEKPGGETRFPLLWRNDAFPADSDFVVEIRFRFSRVTPYGVTIGLGSRFYDGTRYFEEGPPVPGIEDILSIHHFDESFHILLLGQVVWEGRPGDEQWHDVRLAQERGKYILSVDAVERARIAASLRAVSTFLGNPAIERYTGPWTWLDVDYLRVSQCAAWSRSISYLPLLLKAP